MAGNLVQVFGCGLEEVDQILIRMAMASPRPPVWLKGVKKIQDLPRFTKAKLEKKIELTGLDSSEFTQRIVWVVENLADEWSLSGQTLFLNTNRDQVHYSMMWSDF